MLFSLPGPKKLRRWRTTCSQGVYPGLKLFQVAETMGELDFHPSHRLKRAATAAGC